MLLISTLPLSLPPSRWLFSSCTIQDDERREQRIPVFRDVFIVVVVVNNNNDVVVFVVFDNLCIVNSIKRIM